MSLPLSVSQYDLHGNYIDTFNSITDAARLTGIDRTTISKSLSRNGTAGGYSWRYADNEIVAENVRLSKQKQKFADTNRIERKAFREHARIENAITEYTKELSKILKVDRKKFSKIIERKKLGDEKGVKAVIQLSDTHFNELVEMEHNRYDFSIASKRLKLFADSIRRYCSLHNVKTIAIAMSGDLMNSDRRLDEMLNMATNRAKATSLSYILLRYFILDLAQYFNIELFGVTGNESRSKDILGWSEVAATDSYDWNIYDMLRITLNSERIKVHMLQANEETFSMNSLNFLIIHGHQLKKDTQDSVQKMIGKHAAKGMIINYVLCGHIHTTSVSDYFSRNSSLVGSNAYSEEGLMYVSKAAQNLHLIYPNKRVDSIKVDLQDWTQSEGYPIESDVDAYNAKSAKKTKQQDIIMKIVI